MVLSRKHTVHIIRLYNYMPTFTVLALPTFRPVFGYRQKSCVEKTPRRVSKNSNNITTVLQKQPRTAQKNQENCHSLPHCRHLQIFQIVLIFRALTRLMPGSGLLKSVKRGISQLVTNTKSKLVLSANSLHVPRYAQKKGVDGSKY